MSSTTLEARSASPAKSDPEPQVEIDTGKRTKAQTVLVMMALCMSTFLAALDVTIVTTALPTISEYFHSRTGYIWIGSAFMLAAAASTPNWGKLSDIWGRKAILLIASVVFFLGCALCGSAVSVAMLIVGRAVQGYGAGGLLTLSQIVIGDLFSQRERGKYYGMLGAIWALAASLGPVAGGALTDKVSWRWCFYINLPISGTAIAIIALTLRLTTTKTPIMAGLKAMDWLGNILITGSTVMFLLGLEFGGSSLPWNSVTVICLITFGIVAFLLFALVERFIARSPIIPPSIVTVSNLAIYLVDFFHGIVFTQATYFLPLYFQAVLGASPLLSGVWLLPLALSLAFTAVAAGIYIKKTGRYLDCIRGGLAVAVIGCGLSYTLPASRSWLRIILYQIIVGIGAGANFQPPLVALQSSVSGKYNAAATASYALVRNVATAIAVVIGSVGFANEMDSQQDTLRTLIGGRAAELFSGRNAQANLFVIDTLSASQQKAVRDALYASMKVIWLETVTFAAAGLLASLFIRKRKLETTHEIISTGLGGEKDQIRVTQDKANLPEKTISVPEEKVSASEETLSVPEEKVSVPEETVDIPEKRVDVPENRVDLPEEVNVREEDVHVAEENVNLPEEHSSMLEEKTDTVNEGVHPPGGRVDRVGGVIHSPKETANLPNENVDALERRADIPKGKADIPEGKIDIAEEKADITEDKVVVPEEKADIAEKKVDVPEVKVDIPEGKADIAQNKVKVPEEKVASAENVDVPEEKVNKP